MSQKQSRNIAHCRFCSVHNIRVYKPVYAGIYAITAKEQTEFLASDF